MQKAMVFAVLLALGAAAVGSAEEGLLDVGDKTKIEAPVQPTAPPLLLAIALPGMTDEHGAGDRRGAPASGKADPARLPGVSDRSRTASARPAAKAQAGLPQPLISDLTNISNPFDSRKSGVEGETQILYRLTKDARVTVTLYSLLGAKVRSWNFAPGVNGGRQGGNNVVWDGTNETGEKVAKGGYLAEVAMETPEGTATAVRKIGVIH